MQEVRAMGLRLNVLFTLWLLPINVLQALRKRVLVT